MDSIQGKQNELFLLLGTEVARIRTREDLLYIIRTLLKKHIPFNDSFIFRYDKITQSAKAYICQFESDLATTTLLQQQLEKKYAIDKSFIDGEGLLVPEQVVAGSSMDLNKIPFINHEAIKEYVFIKLIERNVLIGFFILLSEKKGVFTKNVINLIKSLSNLIAIATANIIATEETIKNEKENEILVTLSKSIASVKNRQELFHLTVTKIKSIFSVEEFALTQIDEGGKTYSAFMIDIKSSQKNHPDFTTITTAHYPVTDVVFATVTASGDFVVFDVEDLLKLPDFPLYVPYWKSLGVKKMLFIALRVGGKAVGMAGFHIDNNHEIFEKIELLKGICAQLGVAMSNILSNEEIIRREDEKSRLLEFSNAIASGLLALNNTGFPSDKGHLSKILKYQLRNLFDIADYIIHELNKDKTKFKPLLYDPDAGYHKHEDFIRTVNTFTDLRDANFEKILVAEDPFEFTLENSSNPPVYENVNKDFDLKTAVGMPIRLGEEVIALLIFTPVQSENFYSKKQPFKNICAQLAIAVSNILAYENIKERSEEKIHLLDLSNEIAALKTREDLFHVVNTKIKKILSVDEFGIAQVDEGGETYSAFALEYSDKTRGAHGFQVTTSSKYDTKDPIFIKVRFAEGPVLFNVDELSLQSGMPAYVKFWKSTGLKYFLTVPLKAGGAMIGFVNIHFENKADAMERHTLLKSICSQLAVGVSNILSNEKIMAREKEKNLLLSISNEIAAVKSREDLFKVVNGKVKQLFSVKQLGFTSLDEGGNTFSVFLVDVGEAVTRHPDFVIMMKEKFDAHEALSEEVLKSPNPILYNIAELLSRPETPSFINFLASAGIDRIVLAPLRVGGVVIGTAQLIVEKGVDFDINSTLLKGVCSQLAVAMSNILANEKIKSQLLEIEKYRQQLEDEKVYLKEEIETTHNYTEIIGASPSLKKVFHLIEQVSFSDSSVLLLGETGTGKELIARAIHNASPRKGKLMVKVNCAALPANLIESELFGHERGSFTGASDRRIGKFELANHGTLFLDEIGELPLELQVKLLRVLQEKEIERVGGNTTIKVNVRIIAATNRDLEKQVAEGRFRSDLYYRLNIFPILLPPLRERKEDIPTLANHFIRRFSKSTGKKIKTLTSKAYSELMDYNWPGNIRELEHVIERSVLLASGEEIRNFHLPQKMTTANEPLNQPFNIKTIHDMEKEYILKVLKHVDGRISGIGGAADLLGVPPTTLTSKMKRLAIRREYEG